jgi:PIN domain nuclease of toxin-antitoxin system
LILLPDTHVLLWAASVPERLSSTARALLENPDHELIFSVASLWEITIKRGLGRSDFQVEPAMLRRGLLDNGYRELPISGAHALGVGQLPLIHGDPFDRLMLSQAAVEGALLLTVDEIVARYPVPVRLV